MHGETEDVRQTTFVFLMKDLFMFLPRSIIEHWTLATGSTYFLSDVGCHADAVPPKNLMFIFSILQHFFIVDYLINCTDLRPIFEFFVFNLCSLVDSVQ